MDKIIEQLDAIEAAVAGIRSLLTVAEDTEILDGRTVSWGKKFSPKFKASLFWIEDQLHLDADKLANCIAFETGATFDPAIKNLAGSSGTGLIQFMEATVKQMIKRYPVLAQQATNTKELAKLTAEQQLGWVYYYFRGFGSDFSAWTQEDVYMAILYPAAIGKDPEWVMPWKYGQLAYKQNAGLDLNKDRKITKKEAAAGVLRMAALGEQQRG